MKETFIACATGVAALLNHIKIEKWAEKHELAPPLLAAQISADDGMSEIAPCIVRSYITEDKETANLYKNHYTTWGQNSTTWVDYVTTTWKTNRIFWRYFHKVSLNSAEPVAKHYEQLMVNGCNPKLLADQSHLRALKRSVAMLELERRIGNSSEHYR